MFSFLDKPITPRQYLKCLMWSSVGYIPYPTHPEIPNLLSIPLLAPRCYLATSINDGVFKNSCFLITSALAFPLHPASQCRARPGESGNQSSMIAAGWWLMPGVDLFSLPSRVKGRTTSGRGWFSVKLGAGPICRPTGCRMSSQSGRNWERSCTPQVYVVLMPAR